MSFFWLREFALKLGYQFFDGGLFKVSLNRRLFTGLSFFNRVKAIDSVEKNGKSIKFIEIPNQQAYLKYKAENKEVLENRKGLEFLLPSELEEKDDHFIYRGYDELEDRLVRFFVSKDLKLKVGEKEIPNYRESTISSESNLNGRMRALLLLLKKFEVEGKVNLSTARTYMSEQITTFFKYYKGKFPQVIGSEFISAEVAGGGR